MQVNSFQRTKLACIECRAVKVKCIPSNGEEVKHGLLPSTTDEPKDIPCRRCVRLGIQCEYPAQKTKSKSQNSKGANGKRKTDPLSQGEKETLRVLHPSKKISSNTPQRFNSLKSIPGPSISSTDQFQIHPIQQQSIQSKVSQIPEVRLPDTQQRFIPPIEMLSTAKSQQWDSRLFSISQDLSRWSTLLVSISINCSGNNLYENPEKKRRIQTILDFSEKAKTIAQEILDILDPFRAHLDSKIYLLLSPDTTTTFRLIFCVLSQLIELQRSNLLVLKAISAQKRSYDFANSLYERSTRQEETDECIHQHIMQTLNMIRTVCSITMNFAKESHRGQDYLGEKAFCASFPIKPTSTPITSDICWVQEEAKRTNKAIDLMISTL